VKRLGNRLARAGELASPRATKKPEPRTVSERNAHSALWRGPPPAPEELLACNGRLDSRCPAPRGGRPHPHRGREMESDVEH
jgi:hypothetical protein